MTDDPGEFNGLLAHWDRAPAAERREFLLLLTERVLRRVIRGEQKIEFHRGVRIPDVDEDDGASDDAADRDDIPF